MADEHPIRFFQQRPPEPGSDGKLTLVICRLEGWQVSEYDDNPHDGCTAMNHFYRLVLDKACIFVGLYGPTGDLINNWYRGR